jgi:hypothetical protein
MGSIVFSHLTNKIGVTFHVTKDKQKLDKK